MKRNTNTYKQLRKLLLIAAFAIFSVVTFGQNPPPPPGGATGTENTGSNQLGGNAHIGGGMLILMTLAMAYGGKRIYNFKNDRIEELSQ